MGAMFSSQPHFVNSGDGDVPDGACLSGYGNEGKEYVGRAYHDGCVLIGRVVPSHGVCYVGYQGEELPISKYQVLVASEDQVKYKKASDGKVPRGAIVAGHNREGMPLYVARCEHEGIMCGGHFNPEHSSTYIPYGGEEHSYGEYEVLCVRQVHIN